MKSSPYSKTLKELGAGYVSPRAIIGLRKALNADWRRERGYSVSTTSSKMTTVEIQHLLNIIRKKKPCIKDEKMINKGIHCLYNLQFTPNHTTRKRAPFDELDAVCFQSGTFHSFHLVDYDLEREGQAVPVYMIVSKTGRSITYSKRPWQAGGHLEIY